MIANISSTALETLAIDPATITPARAQKVDRACSAVGAQTTTELLALLAEFHLDAEDAVGAALLAEFAARFADHEATIV